MPFRYIEAMVEPPREKINVNALLERQKQLEWKMEELQFDIDEIEDLRNTCMPSLYDNYTEKYDELIYELNNIEDEIKHIELLLSEYK